MHALNSCMLCVPSLALHYIYKTHFIIYICFTSAVEVTVADFDSVDDKMLYIFTSHPPNTQPNCGHYEASVESNRHFNSAKTDL